MSKIFAFATQNSYDEEVFQLTTIGIIVVIAVMAALICIALFLKSKKEITRTTTTKQLVFSAVAMALAVVTSMIKFANLPMGGSVTLFSMLFIVLIGYWYGPRAGITTAIAYGLLQFILEPVFYSIPQMIVDYPLAFGALGLSGFFSGKKFGLQLGYVLGVAGRYVFAVISGVLFFAVYAEGTGMSAPVYSMAYNATYIVPEAVVTLIILAIPAVSKAFAHVKKMTKE